MVVARVQLSYKRQRLTRKHPLNTYNDIGIAVNNYKGFGSIFGLSDSLPNGLVVSFGRSLDAFPAACLADRWYRPVRPSPTVQLVAEVLDVPLVMHSKQFGVDAGM